MKIRTDFVTNSSSSSFITIKYSNTALEAYLEQKDLTEIWDEILYYYGEDILRVELTESFSESMVVILKDFLEEYEYTDYVENHRDDIHNLRKFLIKNKELIDYETNGSIVVNAELPEDGFAYAQSLVYKKHHGKITKWPFADGWNLRPGEGYERIQKLNGQLLDGEIQELIDLAYKPVWEIVGNESYLKKAIEKTGFKKEFDLNKPDLEKKIDFEDDLSLEEIDPVNLEWINHSKFALLDLDEDDDEIAEDLIETNGGTIEDDEIDYAIYNPYAEYISEDTIEIKNKVKNGSHICLLTVSEFCKKLLSADKAKTHAENNIEEIVPTTLKECKKLFKIEEDDDEYCIYGSKKSVPEVIIPGTIEGKPVSIGQDAFKRSKLLEKVIFCEGVREIGSDAFNDCKQLKEVQFASTIEKVGTGLFYRSPWLKDQGDYLIINNILVKYFGDDESVIIPDGVTRINEYAFSSNYSMRNIVIPESVTSIGDNAFSMCGKLINIQFPNHPIEFGKDVFLYTAWADNQDEWIIVNKTLLGFSNKYYDKYLGDLESLEIPSDVEIIGPFAFSSSMHPNWMKRITEIKLPDHLRVIGDSAFNGFSNVTEIKLPETVETIGKDAFSSCGSLQRINLPEGLLSIGKTAFSSGFNDESNCLEEIKIPDSVEYMEYGVFDGCKNLNSLILPQKLGFIPDFMANGCSNLKTVKMPEECRHIGNSAFDWCDHLVNIKLPNDLETIGQRAFNGCKSLKELELPKTVRKFGWSTFANCSSITSIVIPEGVTELPSELFKNCNSLETVHVPESVKSIETDTFSNCPKLTITVCKGSYAHKFAEKNGIQYLVL